MPNMLFRQKRWVNSSLSRPLIKQDFLIVAIFFLTISFAHAQVQPTLTAVFPQGGQQGQEMEVTLKGTNLGTATAVWFSGSGITGEIKEKTGQAAVLFNGAGISGRIPADAQLVASLTIAPDAQLGIQQIRIVTPYGVSNARSFVVGNLREVMEAEAEELGSEMETDWLALPVTVNGTIASIDDKDSFTFELKKNARLICEVTAQRIGSLLDSYLVLQDANGTEVANSGLGDGFDSVLDYIALETGKYTLYIRDIRYKGGNGYDYRLSIGELPYLETIFPLGGRRGTENTITVTGANLETVTSIQVSIGAETPAGQQSLRVQTPSGLATNPRPFAIGNWAEMAETEPNNTADKANAVTTPITLNGKIDKSGDVDRFSFEIAEPQLLVFEVEARKLSSNLDALLTLYGPDKPMGEASEEMVSNGEKEQVLMVNDDASSADARIDWNFAEAGKYSITIRDLNNQGGETYPYRLNIRPLEPNCQLSVITLDNRNRPSAMDNPRVSRGGSVTMQVNVVRLDQFKGPIRLLCPDLPKTFDVSPTIIGVGQNQALLTVTAPWDAPLGLMSLSVVGVCAVGNSQIERVANPSPILLTVMDAPEFTLRLAEIGLSAVHNKTVDLHVTADRHGDFVGPIALSVSGLPNRVSAAAVTIAEGETAAMITVKAGTFERREQFSVLPIPGTNYISVNGTATVSGETVKQSTPAIPLTIVEAPFIVTVEPLRFSIVFPATSKGDTATLSNSGTVAIAANPTADTEATENEAPLTKEAMLTLTIVRQGGFTDEITLTPLDVPKGFTTEAATIPANETEVKIPLQALSSLTPETYQFKFRGSATINGKPFEQDSPVLQVKIIH
ncbi:MAG: IPT/TIG domain-containing protein [Candidatus Poribacteria bacterium]|nr:IPT/TIG domain-containing protein [Candidatus Poribacteria bacterium]